VFDNAQNRPTHVAFSRKFGSIWAPVTSLEFADDVLSLAAGLIDSGIGVGDRIALMSGTSYEWMLFDYAIWSAGAVTVPNYETSSDEQVEWYLSDSGANADFRGSVIR
jgi:long-chain acyl-CoA synthetase